MKKILILSYHFPPMNVIASQRALGYANHLKKFGFEPTILTFDWSKPIDDQYCTKEEFEGRIIEEKNDNYNVIKIPLVRNKLYRFIDKQQGNIIYKLWVIWCWLTGNLDVNPRVLEHGKSEQFYLEHFVNREDFDVVMGIYSPHFHLKNCYWLSRKTSVPYALDFRDFWTNLILFEDYKAERNKRFRDKMMMHYWKKYSKPAVQLSIIGEVWVEKLKSVTGNQNVRSIFNGFQNEINQKVSACRHDRLKISYTGTLYEWQEYKMLVDGVKKFLNTLDKDNANKVQLDFIGTNKKGRFEVVVQYIRQELAEFNLNMIDRVEKEETIRMQQDSDILLFPTAAKVKGFYSGKIFEYISSGSTILAGPEDVSAVTDLVTSTRTGRIYNSSDELYELLSEIFWKWNVSNDWKLTNANIDEIAKYSREYQSFKLAEGLSESLIK